MKSKIEYLIIMLGGWLYTFFGLTAFVVSSEHMIFTNSFLVRFQQKINNDKAHEIAVRNGFENVGEVRTCCFENVQCFEFGYISRI